MTPEQAEQQITKLCLEIDVARARNDQKRVTEIDKEIAELVKVTGPRSATGTMGIRNG